MKTTDPRDPLDQEIDRMLAERPIQADARFLEDVLAAVEQAGNAPSTPNPSWSRRVALYMMPLAAAIAIVFALSTQGPETSRPGSSLSLVEAQEILDLTQALSGLSLPTESNSGSELELLATFDAIYFEIES